jgi:hypothetical protein
MREMRRKIPIFPLKGPTEKKLGIAGRRAVGAGRYLWINRNYTDLLGADLFTPLSTLQ